METHAIFNDIASTLGLGSVTSPVQKLTGGYAHEVFSLETDKGKYAIKLLNQETMSYQGEILATSEHLEKILQGNGIPIVPSLEFNGTKMQCIDNRHFYIFDFIDGKTLATQEIQKEHCEIIGSVLAKIHKIKHDAKSFERYEIKIDWDLYIQIAMEKRSEIAELLKDTREVLYKAQTDSNAAYKAISDSIVISNGDMDSKNVLWADGKPHIIDLEYLSFTNPYIELFQLALCWSGCEHYAINYELLKVFVESYVQEYGAIEEDLEVLYKSNSGSRLEWLEVNVRKALMIDCDNEEERSIGTKHAKEAIRYTVYYNQVKDELLNEIAQNINLNPRSKCPATI